MELSCSTDQQALEQSIAEVARSASGGCAVDSLRNLRELSDAACLIRLSVPASHGGWELSNLDVVIALKSLAAAGASLRLCEELSLHTACAWIIRHYGSQHQKGHLLPALATGEIIGSVAAPTGGGAGFSLRLDDQPLEAAELNGCGDRPEVSALRVQEMIDTFAAACHTGACLHLFGVMHPAVRRFSQRRKLAGAPAEREQSLYHRLADLRVHLDVVELLVQRAARQLDRPEGGGATAAVARIALAEARNAALRVVDELASRNIPTALPLEELQVRLATMRHGSTLTPSPRTRVADTLWS